MKIYKEDRDYILIEVYEVPSGCPRGECFFLTEPDALRLAWSPEIFFIGPKTPGQPAYCKVLKADFLKFGGKLDSASKHIGDFPNRCDLCLRPIYVGLHKIVHEKPTDCIGKFEPKRAFTQSIYDSYQDDLW